MAKPIINNIIPFDALEEHVFTMSYSGGIPYKNTLIIKDMDSYETVYSETVVTSRLEHRLPAGTLINGKQYVAQCQFFDAAGVASVMSDSVRFITLQTPEYYFLGMTDGGVVESTAIAAEIHYEQENGEPLDSYSFSLYDSAGRLLVATDTSYDTSNVSYTFRGLENKNKYFLRWQGRTKNGIRLDTRKNGKDFAVTISYGNPGIYAHMYVENDPATSAMSYRTNFRIIEAINDEGQFDYEDGYIMLDDGESVIYDGDFSIVGDATWVIKGTNMHQNKTYFKCGDEINGFDISGYLYDDETYRYKLSVHNLFGDYIIYSKPMIFTGRDIVTIWIKRINGIYGINCFVENVDGSSIAGDMYFGLEPSTKSINDVWINLDGMNETVKVAKDDIVEFIQNEKPTNVERFNLWFAEVDK